jgi:hypothetical protein
MLVPQWRIRRPVTQEVLKQGAKKEAEFDLTSNGARDPWPRDPLVMSRGYQAAPGTILHFAQHLSAVFPKRAQSTSDR